MATSQFCTQSRFGVSVLDLRPVSVDLVAFLFRLRLMAIDTGTHWAQLCGVLRPLHPIATFSHAYVQQIRLTKAKPQNTPQSGVMIRHARPRRCHSIQATASQRVNFEPPHVLPVNSHYLCLNLQELPKIALVSHGGGGNIIAMTFGEKVLQASRPDLKTARHQGSGGKTMEIQSSPTQGTLGPGGIASSATTRLDEYEIDFADPRAFVVARWEDLRAVSLETLRSVGSQAHGSIESSQGLTTEIQSKITALKTTPTMKRQMSRIQPLPRVAAALIQAFSNLVAPAPVDLSVIWKLIHLSLKMSYTSSTRLERISNLLHKTQRAIELFNGCLENLQKPSEASVSTSDFLDTLLSILCDVVEYLHESSSGK
ncbi:hypothetical protein DL95DRAFT_456464 [Leptodontidium sp. 2 PMI_412]|nr:hypothetical protein DL95DRAFT_456464 [Leptodontidium sp. 2 PMI_412]